MLIILMLAERDLLNHSSKKDLVQVIKKDNLQVETNRAKKKILSDLRNNPVSKESEKFLLERLKARKFGKNAFFIYILGDCPSFQQLKRKTTAQDYADSNKGRFSDTKADDSKFSGIYAYPEKEITIKPDGTLGSYDKAIPTSLELRSDSKVAILRASTHDKANIVRKVLSKLGVELTPLDFEVVPNISKQKISSWHKVAKKYLKVAGVDVE